MTETSPGPSSPRTSDLFPELIGRDKLPEWAQGKQPEPVIDPEEEGWWSHPKRTALVRRGERVEVDLFTVGNLADALGVRPVTIRKWESEGKLPPPVARTPPPRNEQVPGKQRAGHRLYTRNQIIAAIKAATTYNILSRKPDWAGFTAAVVEAWSNL